MTLRMTLRALSIVLVLSCILSSACGFIGRDSIPPPADVAAPPSDAAKTSTGLASRVLTPGKGTRHPRPNSRVTVHYTGWTTDGKTFDSSVSKGPITFGLDEVIPGWTEGVR